MAARIFRYEFQSGDDTHYIFSRFNALDTFISGLTQVSADEAINIMVPVKGFTRRQYPGQGSPVSVSSTTRRKMVLSRSKWQTLPGSNVYFELEIFDGVKNIVDVTQATTTAAFIDLHSYCVGNSVTAFVLRSPAGVPYTIKDSTATP